MQSFTRCRRSTKVEKNSNAMIFLKVSFVQALINLVILKIENTYYVEIVFKQILNLICTAVKSKILSMEFSSCEELTVYHK